MPELGPDVDEAEFQKELNAELVKADLFCPGSSGTGPDPCGDTGPLFSELGFLDDLSIHRVGDIVFQRQPDGKLQRQQHFLVVKTGIGILMRLRRIGVCL